MSSTVMSLARSSSVVLNSSYSMISSAHMMSILSLSLSLIDWTCLAAVYSLAVYITACALVEDIMPKSAKPKLEA